MKSAKAFIKSLRTSGDLQETISQSDWSVDAIVKAGASAGFAFSGDEYRAAYAALADEELAAVTGGLSGGTCGSAWKDPDNN